MWSASFTNAPTGDYYLDVQGNGGSENITDLTVAQVGGGRCHRTLSIMPSTYATDTADADDEEDDTCDDAQAPFVNSLTYHLGRTETPAETHILLGISTPTLPLVTFNFSLPDDRQLKSCTLGEVRSHEIEATKQGNFSAAFKNVPIGSSILRVHLDDGSTASYPIEVVEFAKIQPPECEEEEQVVEA
jgi:hypothetical protein